MFAINTYPLYWLIELVKAFKFDNIFIMKKLDDLFNFNETHLSLTEGLIIWKHDLNKYPRELKSVRKHT